MSKESTILLLGVLIAIMPFLGFPNPWENILLVIFGLSIALVGFLLRQRNTKEEVAMPQEKRTDVFIQNGKSEADEMSPLPSSTLSDGSVVSHAKKDKKTA